MLQRLFARPLGGFPACLLGACLATSVALADPVGQSPPADGASQSPSSQPSTSAPPAPPTGSAATTPAPNAPITPPAPSTAPALPNAPAAALSPAKPSPQLRATLSQVEKRITDLHDKLHITAALQPLWDGFAEAMRQNARDMDAAVEQRRRSADGMTALADMQSYADLAQMHAAQMSKLVSSFATLYDAMPDEQKKQADAAFKAFQNQASAGRRPG